MRSIGGSTASIGGLTGSINAEAIYGRLERLEHEYYAITQALRRIEAAIADEKTKREMIERSLRELRDNVAALQARIEEIEQRIRE